MHGRSRESRLLNRDFRDMLSALSDEHAEFLLVGAYALAVHGLPRATGDLDLWIRSSADNAGRVWRALVRFGAPVGDLRQEDLRTPGVVVQIGVAPRRIDLLTSIDAVEFDDAWAQRTEVELEGVRVPVIGRRELIVNKKAVGRPQDLADVARLENEPPVG
jgi:predicted nucleotidyltransferase